MLGCTQSRSPPDARSRSPQYTPNGSSSDESMHNHPENGSRNITPPSPKSPGLGGFGRLSLEEVQGQLRSQPATPNRGRGLHQVSQTTAVKRPASSDLQTVNESAYSHGPSARAQGRVPGLQDQPSSRKGYRSASGANHTKKSAGKGLVSKKTQAPPLFDPHSRSPAKPSTTTDAQDTNPPVTASRHPRAEPSTSKS